MSQAVEPSPPPMLIMPLLHTSTQPESFDMQPGGFKCHHSLESLGIPLLTPASALVFHITPQLSAYFRQDRVAILSYSIVAGIFGSLAPNGTFPWP